MKYDDAIQLDPAWPKPERDANQMTAKGFVRWSASYFDAAETLYASQDSQNRHLFFVGPVMQMTGLSAELALKALLTGGGATEKQLRGYNYNTYKAYYAARDLFSEEKFIDLVFINTAHLKTPAEVIDRYAGQEDDPNIMWRVFFRQLKVLDDVYDRPFKSRYVTPGAIAVPEPYIILVGVKLLLNAMLQRLDLPLVQDTDS